MTKWKITYFRNSLHYLEYIGTFENFSNDCERGGDKLKCRSWEIISVEQISQEEL